VAIALDGVTYDPATIAKDRGQGVFAQSFLQFSGRMVNSNRLQMGSALLKKYAGVFDRIEQQYGVPGPVLVAFWGLETDFGKVMGNMETMRSLATLSFDCRRPEEFREQLMYALKVVERGDLSPDEMRGPAHGEVGQFQFQPKNYYEHAVDFDGDGRRDVWNSVPDALGSTGNSLHSQGWDGKQTWGYEVTLPKGFDCTEQGPDKARPIAEWVKLGVARVKDRPFPEDKLGDPAFLVLPAGLKGPAFLATNNFSVLKLYNNSDVYALFVGHVADMIATNAPIEFAGEWQLVERLPRERIQRFQEVLVAKGHDVGKVDGLAGFKTRRTIGIEEQKLGLPLSCYPNKTVVDAVLKQASAAAAQ
jgi:lytic murein transglycosylase